MVTGTVYASGNTFLGLSFWPCIWLIYMALYGVGQCALIDAFMGTACWISCIYLYRGQ